MPKILLTSCGFYTDRIKNQFLELIERDKSQMKVAIITTASPKKENNIYAQKALEDFKEMGFQHIDFIDLEVDDASRLYEKDIIYVNGGNPFNLLHHIRKSGADSIIKHLVSQNVIVVGVSAGAVVLGPHLKIVQFFTPHMNIHNIKEFSALNITDKLIFPHYDREDVFKDEEGKTIEIRIKAFEKLEQCSVTRLNDDQSILIVN